MPTSKAYGAGTTLTLLAPLAAALALSACGQREAQDGGSATYGNEMNTNPMAGETGDADNMSGAMMPGTNGMSNEAGAMGTGGLPATGVGETGTAPSGGMGSTTNGGTGGTQP